VRLTYLCERVGFPFQLFLSFLGAAELVKGYAGVYVLSLGKFELATNAYTSPTEKFYRIQANLSQNVDLRHYLFDEHLLTLEIEGKRGTVDKFGVCGG